MSFDDATLRQITAADPQASTWLSANAGSGKTRVLTDRVARLLLSGVSPQNILCLTYTKAAATEMQNRLFQRLGAWAMKSDDALMAELRSLGVTDHTGADQLAQARTLFARAIETPGGLRIQTIHSFCASLLRRFPLEAGVSPVFREFDDRSAKLLRQDIVEEMADGPQSGLVQNLARHYTGEDFDSLTQEIVGHAPALRSAVSRADIWARFNLSPDYGQDQLIASVFAPGDAAMLAQLIPLLAAGSKTEQDAADALRNMNLDPPDSSAISIAISVFLFKGGKTPFKAKIGSFPTKKFREDHPDLTDALNAFMGRVEEARIFQNRLYSAEKTFALHQFAAAFLDIYDSRKAQAGWLDFDDLIALAERLLTDPAVAQWVLFRLDGGLDHILVDEAQDTSPAQWRIIELLAREFSTGLGAREDAQRTIFVVGDIKQSIYSFQGADPLAFDQMRHHFGQQLTQAGKHLAETSLDHSFRSSAAILGLVDSVFETTPGPGFDGAHHIAFQQSLPGRVDLWPLVETHTGTEQKEWYDPTDMLAANDHRVTLANAIAEQIQNLAETGSIPDNNGGFRKIDYGDFLILVQRRSNLFHEIIRACKARNLPIAGADRLRIGAELAVKDLQALLTFLATPDDNLSLAAVLRSPLFGLTEAELFDLAHDRPDPQLWASLARRQNDFPEVFEVLSALRNRADFLAPFEILERVLTRYDGRRKLLARLGPEAEDGIDALLTQAVEYEHSETPSLTGFLMWLETDDVEIKRQSDTAGGRIRVMTTHGAKGLEEEIVILPDTGDRPIRQRDQLITLDDQSIIWKPGKDLLTEEAEQALSLARTAQDQERDRLLYVALTRAKRWLIVCASGEAKETNKSWYRQVETGLNGLGPQTVQTPVGDGLRWQVGEWAVADDTDDTLPSHPATPVLPDWARGPAPAAPAPDRTLSPSDLGGAKSLFEGISERDAETAAQRGNLLHLLFEHLPGIDPSEWAEIAQNLLVDADASLSQEDIDSILAEATRVITAPDLRPLFGPDALAEVDVSAQLPELDNAQMFGAIDRLIVTPDMVLIVDFKSNQSVPATPADVPEGIARQMGAYLSAVEQIFTDRPVNVAVLWTHTAQLMPLSAAFVRQALCRATSP